MGIRVMKTLVWCATLVAICLGPLCASDYQVIDLGVGAANDVNNAGQIVGWAYSADGQQHAYSWQGGTATDLGTLGSATFSEEGYVNYTSSWATSINNKGQVVGTSYNPAGDQCHGSMVETACLWQNGTVTGMLDWSYGSYVGYSSSSATAINDWGLITTFDGSVNSASGAAGRLWQGVWNGPCSDAMIDPAYCINSSGQMAGAAFASYPDPRAGGRICACLYYYGTQLGGAWGLLRTVLWPDGRANGINNNGLVVGTGPYSSETSPSGLASFGCLWQDGSLSYLWEDGEANDVNDLGQIVGRAGSSACLWDNGVMTYLDGLGGSSVAKAINEDGDIVGYSYDSNGVSHAVLWQPVPEPPSLVPLLFGLAGCVRLIGRRRLSN